MNAEESPDALQPHAQNLESATAQSISPAAALRFFAFGFLLCAILAGGLMWFLQRPQPPPIVLHPPPTPPTVAPTPTPLPTATPAPIIVFVTGGVHAPGMYQLPAHARVGDALAKAGGLLPEADSALVNQAELVFDGAQIHVPLPQPTLDAAAATAAIAAPIVQQPAAGLSGQAPPTKAFSQAPGDGLVNVNTATLEALATLPGIGPSKAEAIVANRPYQSVEDLERVPGIGARTIEILAPLVTVSGR